MCASTLLVIILLSHNITRNKFEGQVLEVTLYQNILLLEIIGPEDTPYFKGVFKLEIIIPERYVAFNVLIFSAISCTVVPLSTNNYFSTYIVL